MSIIDTINDSSHFYHWLQQSGSYKDNFSYEGANAVQEYMDEYSEETETGTIEFDPVAWCVEFSEYDSTLEAAQDLGYEEVVDLEPYGSLDITEVQKLEEAQALEWLQVRTTVIELDNGHIIVGEF